MARARVEFSDWAYRWSHGRKPRGRGCWGFETTDRGRGTGAVLWASSGLTLTEAKREITRRVKDAAGAMAWPTTIRLQVAP